MKAYEGNGIAKGVLVEKKGDEKQYMDMQVRNKMMFVSTNQGEVEVYSL